MEAFTKADVVEAVKKVTRFLPGCNVPRDFIRQLYDKHNVGEFSDELKAQINELGKHVRYAYHSRYVSYHDGIRLDTRMFPNDSVDNFIRGIDWYESSKEDRLMFLPSMWMR